MANITNNFFEIGELAYRILALFYKIAEVVSKNSSKIFVASVGKEASGVGQHSYKVAIGAPAE